MPQAIDGRDDVTGSARGIGALCGLVAALWLGGCGVDDRAGEPMVPAFGGADEDLVGFLEELLAGARSAPESGDLRGRLAMAYDVNGFDTAAIATYEQAELLEPASFDWPYFRALLLGKRADFAAALAALDRAMAIDDGYVPAWLHRGAWLAELARLEEAAAAYERAADLGAGSPAVAGLAQVLLDQSRPAEAAEILEPMNDRLPHPHLYRMLGQAYNALGRPDDARIAFARGRDPEALHWLDPRLGKRTDYIGGFSGRLVHAQNLIGMGAADEALDLMRSLGESHADDISLISSLTWAYTELGRLDEALEVLDRGFETYPDNFRLHRYAANAHRKRGDRVRLRHHLERVVGLNPSDAWAHEQLGLLATQESRLDDAIAAFEAAFRHGTESPVKVAHTAGMIEGSRERWREAIGWFERAVAIDESFTLGFVYLGRCRAEAHRFDDARDAFSWADKLGTHPEALAGARKRMADIEAGLP